jgi:hypothetical protein
MIHYFPPSDSKFRPRGAQRQDAIFLGGFDAAFAVSQRENGGRRGGGGPGRELAASSWCVGESALRLLASEQASKRATSLI